MTQEEKARAYDETMNKIKPLYEQAKKDGNPIWSTYEYLVPELRESEDERIRKWIVKFFVEQYPECWKDKKDKMLAYLEKQKDQKPEIRVKIPKFRVGDIIQHIPLEKWDSSKKIVSIDECGYNYDLSHLGDTVSGGAIGFAFEDEYELVEQKPSEWRHYIWAINMRFDYTALIKYDDTNNYEIVQAGNRPKQEKNGVYILIKDIKPQSHWKPSDEQLRPLEYAIDYFKKKGNDTTYLESLDNDLKKL